MFTTQPEDQGPVMETVEETARSNSEIINKDVKSLVDQRQEAGEVRNAVIQKLADDIIQDRTQMLLTALKKKDELTKNLYRIKPDNVLYHPDGSKANESYTKPKLEELKKAKEALDKIEKSIDKAVLKADYEGIKNL